MKWGTDIELYYSFRHTLQQFDCTIDSLGISGNNDLIWRVDVCDSTNLTFAGLQTDLLNPVSPTPQNRSHRARPNGTCSLHIRPRDRTVRTASANEIASAAT